MAMTDDELLTPKPAATNDALKAAVLTRTIRRVRLNAWRRRAMLAVAGLACFGLGWAATFLRAAPAAEVVYIEVSVGPGPVADAPSPPAPTKAEPPVPKLSPPEMELAAEQIPDKAEAARRFREAGDRYLREFGNYTAALRCYRNFLDEADPTDRAVSPDDTWLLTSLKRAREQESAQ
jgi:hypothetical protein